MMTCSKCGAPCPCDCWKAALSPEQRQHVQMRILEAYLAKLDIAEARRAFEKRQVGRPRYIRGQFGNQKAASRRKAG